MALKGTFRDMPLSDLVQIFQMGPKTGVLILVSGEERGVVYVAQGRLIDAAVIRGAQKTLVAAQEAAVLRMFTWDDAHFIFRHDPAAGERPVRIRRDGEALMVEGMRRRSEPARALPHQTVTLDTVLQIAATPGSSETSVSLDVDQWRIMNQAATPQTLSAICAASRIEPATAARIAAELLALGLLEVARPRAAAAPRSSRLSARVADAIAARMRPDQPLQQAEAGSADAPPAVNRGLLQAIVRRIEAM